MRNRNRDLEKIILLLKILVALLLIQQFLAIPVPSPKDMNLEAEPFTLATLMSDVRVVIGTSSCDQNAKAISTTPRTGTKINEVWALVGCSISKIHLDVGATSAVLREPAEEHSYMVAYNIEAKSFGLQWFHSE